MDYTYAAIAAAAAWMAASGGNQRNQLKLPSFRGAVEVRASLPGRMRLYIPALSAREATAQAMKQQLEGTGAVRQVELNPRTCTALIYFDPSQVEAAVVEGAVIKLMGLDEAVKKRPASRMETGLKTIWESVDHGVLEATNGLMDARMLTGSALALAALRGFMRDGATLPGAATLLWWASNIFRGRGHE
ncbi:MAG: hypothetical protein IJ646_05340 [Clostridia bacterium]|nr:hypothetical protein [Clostridia bacterium]